MRPERIKGADAEARLARALVTKAAAAGLEVRIADHRSRPWASATFVGARHTLALVAPRAAGLGDWLAALSDAELALTGHIVADLSIERIVDDGKTVTATIAVLTIED